MSKFTHEQTIDLALEACKRLEEMPAVSQLSSTGITTLLTVMLTMYAVENDISAAEVTMETPDGVGVVGSFCVTKQSEHSETLQ